MELTRVRDILCGAALAVPTFAQDRVQITDVLYPGAVAGDRGPLLTRLVDDLSGEPIGGADVFLVAERKTPIAGEFWWELRGSSDADGFVRIERPNGDRGWHLMVMKHPTRGTAARSSRDPVWRVGRVFHVPLRIVDWMGRPAPGATVGLCGGCGHTPDLVNATADANGKAVLLDVDPRQDIADLYVQHPGLHFFYDSITWRPGDEPMEVRCRQSIAQTGKVVDHRGAPVAGAFVCGGGKHRGPWARTAADGSFAVLGGERDDKPHMVVTPSGREIHFPDTSRFPVTLMLPDLADAEAYQGTIAVPDESDVDAQDAPVKELAVRVLNAPSADLSLEVDYPGRPSRADERSPPGTIEVPRDGPFVLRVHDDSDQIWNPRTFAFADARRVADPLVVVWAPDSRVVGRAVGPDGKAIPARARWLRSAEIAFRSSGGKDESAQNAVAFADGRIDLQRRCGWSLLEIAPDAAGLRPRILWVRVPAPDPASATLDLGDLVCGASPQLRVVGADDEPIDGAEVGYARPGWQEPGGSSPWPIDAKGGWLGPDLREGDCIVVQVDDASLPFRTVLRGAGPWTITPPTGELRVVLVGPDGAPLAGGVTIRDHFVDGTGEIVLRGLAEGAIRLHVGAAGSRSAIVDTTVTSTPRTVRVELPPR